ncbi:MAG: hypothetical protein DME57_08420 [Verrucomicrobia bacterium]|nr:MAG: hypothetical protein DME57_08420 [Verrucomicrobiota bacterium]
MKSKFLILLIGFVAATTQPAVHAQTPALSVSGGGLFGATTGTFGWSFTLSSTISVTDLGYFDFGGNGLNEAHDVGIWTSTGTLMVSATVPAGTAGTLVGDFRYVLVSPTLLAPGDYVIGGFESGSSGDPVEVQASTITTASMITYDGSRSTAGAALTFPSGDASANGNSYFGPNFEFTAVPEPTTIGLLLFGGLGLCRFARKR